MSLFERVIRFSMNPATKVARHARRRVGRPDSYIDGNTAEAIYRHVRAQKPQIAVEVGMANAISTMAILTALEENGGGGVV